MTTDEKIYLGLSIVALTAGAVYVMRLRAEVNRRGVMLDANAIPKAGRPLNDMGTQGPIRTNLADTTRAESRATGSGQSTGNPSGSRANA